MLVAAGAAINGANSHGNTPLHLAAINGHAAACEALVAAGADVAAVNNDGKTAAAVAKNDATKAACTKPQ